MAKSKILIQLDTDPQPSVFDAIVAVDAGVEQLLRHGGVTVDEVQELVYGGMFTRSPADLKSTAIFRRRFESGRGRRDSGPDSPDIFRAVAAIGAFRS